MVKTDMKNRGLLTPLPIGKKKVFTLSYSMMKSIIAITVVRKIPIAAINFFGSILSYNYAPSNEA